MKEKGLEELKSFLDSVPSVKTISGEYEENKEKWWIKIKLDIENPIAWNVVQELGHILNSISTEEVLPTVFMPVSAPPYMNGGPREYLYWIIESKIRTFEPEECLEWLRGRLPSPVEDISLWEN